MMRWEWVYYGTLGMAGMLGLLLAYLLGWRDGYNTAAVGREIRRRMWHD